MEEPGEDGDAVDERENGDPGDDPTPPPERIDEIDLPESGEQKAGKFEGDTESDAAEAGGTADAASDGLDQPEEDEESEAPENGEERADPSAETDPDVESEPEEEERPPEETIHDDYLMEHVESEPDVPADGSRGGLGGPTTDQEMPLTEHIREMLQRLVVVLVLAAVASIPAFLLGEEIIKFLWQSALPVETDWTAPPSGTNARPHIYSPPELVITQLKVASLAGFVLALPMAVYQIYRFMRPGLYPHERRYYLAAVPTSLILAFVGLTFAHFIVIPTVFTYFYQYSQDVTDIAFALGQTFDLILVLMGYLALVFQIPLFIMLAIMMGLVTRRWLADRRLLFWGGFVGISFLFSPDPTGMSPIIIALTMIVLFEGTLLLAKWTRSSRRALGR